MARPAVTGANASGPVQFDERKGSSAKRLTSPERWEIKQLIASGAVSASDVSSRLIALLTLQYPDLDEDLNSSINQPEIDQELDIEVNDIEPSFLSGQTKIHLELSPVKIVKAPDG